MARAKALALLGNRLTAEQAEQWGLIYRWWKTLNCATKP
jgi:2-(1,2-epoxy-1,2-dihydrophenyl)acetyl-CoA isomerase